MATTTTKNKKRKVVRGVEHGLSAYTNYGCKCDVCTEANRRHSARYRRKRFAGSPLCAMENCPHPQSRAYGNSLCHKHAKQVIEFRKRLEEMNRRQLKALIARKGLKVKVMRSYPDDEIRGAILDAMGLPRG